MPLVQCRECAREISSEAKVCPGCGHKQPKRTSKIWYFVAAVVLFAVFKSAFDKVSDPKYNSNVAGAKSAEAAPPSPEQIELDRKLKELGDKRFTAVFTTLTLIKKNLREPKSVEWISSDSTDDGSIVCVEYRARNGFGGMNVESATSAKGMIRTGAEAWNKYCAGKSLRNIKYVQRAID